MSTPASLLLVEETLTVLQSADVVWALVDGASPTHVVEIEGPTVTEQVVVIDEVVTVLSSAEQGPAGALNTEFPVDPLAYYILAKS